MWQDGHSYLFFQQGGHFYVFVSLILWSHITSGGGCFWPWNRLYCYYSLLVIITTPFHLTLHKKANLYNHKGQILICLCLRIRSKYVWFLCFGSSLGTYEIDSSKSGSFSSPTLKWFCFDYCRQVKYWKIEITLSMFLTRSLTSVMHRVTTRANINPKLEDQDLEISI